MSNIFVQLAFILTASSIFGYFMHKFKLPLVVAYLISGLLISNFLPTSQLTVLEFLPDMGIAFVLFLIGMELDLREVKNLGKPIVIASVVQIVFSTLAGFTIAGLFKFGLVESFYMGIGLSFSSTVVVIKLLLEKRDLGSLYGKLSIGILLIEDLIAIGVLMGISVGNSFFSLGVQQTLPLIGLVLKAGGLFLVTYLASRYILEKIFRAVSGSVELLFLTALTWCFLFITLALVIGFSVVIGAFLAGVALASSAYRFQIQGKVKPLRDFFVTLFFVYLGTQAHLGDLFAYWPSVLTLTGYALFIKPLIFLLILGIFGFRRHTLFQTSLNLSQVSEFALVILLLGVKTETASTTALSIMAAVTVISVIISSFLITFSKNLYRYFNPILGFFEHSSKTHFLEKKLDSQLVDHIVVFGANRVGNPLVKFLKREDIPFVVMDFNPKIIEELWAEDITAVYGDIGDPDVLDGVQLETAKLIICTANDLIDNQLLLIECRRRKVRSPIVVRAQDIEDEELLLKMGADYVIIPEKISADLLVQKLKTHWPQIRF